MVSETIAKLRFYSEQYKVLGVTPCVGGYYGVSLIDDRLVVDESEFVGNYVFSEFLKSVNLFDILTEGDFTFYVYRERLK